MTLDLAISWVLPGSELKDPSFSAGIDGGYLFGDQRGFLDLHLAVGFWLVSAGVVASPSYGHDGTGLSLGPILGGHLRLNNERTQHELQFVVRGDIATAGQTEPRFQLTLGLRFVFDLDG